MPSITIDWPKISEDPYGKHFLAALNQFLTAFNNSLGSDVPQPLSAVGSPGTISGPGAAIDHTHSWDGLATAADLANAVITGGGTPPSRQILTGEGLTGGGDLTADLTLSVVFGQTAGTVMEGDDDRIAGALQASTTVGSPTAVVLSVKLADDLTSRFALRGDGTIISGDPPVAVANVAGTSTVTVTTSGDHGFGTGDVVTISGVGGFTGATGIFTVTRTTATAFTLNGATGSGTYTTGGTVQRSLGGTGGINEGVWNFQLPDTSRDGMVIRGTEGSTKQLLTIRDYLGAVIVAVGQVGGLGVYGDKLFTTNDVFGRRFIANESGGARFASGDPAGSVDTVAIGNATSPPTANPDGSHQGEGSFTTSEGAIVWARDGRLRVRTSAGHEDELLAPTSRRTGRVLAPGGDTPLVVDGTLPPTVASTNITITSDDVAAGPLVKYATTATSGVDAGVISAFGVLQRRWQPYFYARIRTDASSITSTRLWIGLTDSELGALAAAPTTQNLAGFRYDTGLDGTAFWRCVTCDGTSATTTTTTRPIAADTDYELALEVNSAGTAIRFWVGGVLAATHTTHLPGASAALAYTARLRTLTTSARALRLGRLTWSQL